MPDIHYGGVLILIFLPYKRALFSSRRNVTATDPSGAAIAYIGSKTAALFFYGNKFPTIQPIACQQQWGSHGHDQTQ
ncbi:TPA: hypothetical protein I4G64_06495 [Enterobacter cloacae]|nr:hypothetical protein [Enterobacter pasteurii]